MRNFKDVLPYVACATLLGVAGYLIFKATPVSKKTDLDNVIEEIRKLNFQPSDIILRDKFISEIQSIYSHIDPEVDQFIKYVWVLSARHSYRQAKVLSSPQNASSIDLKDGFDRMNHGIDIARKVTAKKLGKTPETLTTADIIGFGPMIIYNGEEESNDTLRDVLAKNEIKNYPPEKFIILPLPKDQSHTKGQFESLKKDVETGKIDLNKSTIAIITHGYHWPRTGRIFGKVEGFNYFASTKIIAYLVDRQFKAPDVNTELCQEVQKLPSYVEKKFILPDINADAQFNGAAR